MDIYDCTICDYTTNRYNNYQRHLSSTKHARKVHIATDTINGTATVFQKSCEKKDNTIHEQPSKESQDTKIYNYCKFCNKSFTRSDNLAKHAKFCYAKHSQVDKMSEKLRFLELEHKHVVEKMDHYKQEVEHYKQLLIEAGKLVKSSMNSLTYVVENFEDAPTIKQIKFNDISMHNKNTTKFIEEILSAYKNKFLSKYLGDAIISIYKKKNPEDQSIWNTDTTRLTYLLKELLGNKTSNWIVDKKGIKTREYIIDPVLTHIRKLLLKYNAYADRKKIKPNSVEFEIALENSKALLKLANEIDKGIIAGIVLKYISPRLQLKDKTTK